MKNWLTDLTQGSWQDKFTRSNIEILSALVIALCALGLVFGRIPKQGTLKLDDSKISYSGQVLHSKMEGKGKLTFENGDTYEGNFRNGQFDGKGTFTSASGWTYVGEFKKGLADGNGTLTTENKTVYKGTFKQGIYQDAD